MKILLTGAGGFLGSRLLRRAAARGHEVAGLLTPGTLKPESDPEHGPVTWLEGTLSEAPWKGIEDFKPEVCVHCAWTTAPKFSYDSLEHFRCFEESKAFLQRAINLGVRHAVGLGTCIEYQIGRARLVEDQTPLNPIGPYAESKNAMRAWLEEQSHRDDFRFGWGRIFYVYGVGEHPTRLCSSLIQKLRRDETIILKTPQSTKDYIYGEDVVGALMLMTEQQFAGVVNIGTGLGITILEVAQTVARLLGKTGLVHKAEPPVADPLDYVVADSSRLRRLGWKPEYDLEQGLKQLIDAL